VTSFRAMYVRSRSRDRERSMACAAVGAPGWSGARASGAAVPTADAVAPVRRKPGTMSCCAGGRATALASSQAATRSKTMQTGCPGSRAVTADVRPSVVLTSHMVALTKDSTETTRSPTRRVLRTIGVALLEMPMIVTQPSSVSVGVDE